MKTLEAVAEVVVAEPVAAVPDVILVDDGREVKLFLDALHLVRLPQIPVRDRYSEFGSLLDVRSADGATHRIELIDRTKVTLSAIEGRVVCGELPTFLAIHTLLMISWQPVGDFEPKLFDYEFSGSDRTRYTLAAYRVRRCASNQA